MMKRSLIFILSIIFSIALCSHVNAKVTGVCSNCHTMHNSQGGALMATYGTELDEDTGPFNLLLRGNCLGCHGQNIAGSEYVDLDSQKVPQVWHATSGTQLAGGNFNYTDDAKIHNVKFLNNVEGSVGTTFPPGDEYGSSITAANFTCGGQYGCHGYRTESDSYTAISGAHHGNVTTVLDDEALPTTPATSFRWLLGVKGWENDDATRPWQNYSATVHNEYWGIDEATGVTETSPGTNGTISGLCAECHGDFHDTTDIGGATSPFTRHPADIVLSSGGEYASYTAYSTEAPVARASITEVNQAGNATVVPGTDIVMCLSCHYAHGGPNSDLLRWDNQNNMDGCVVCHTSKD